jgi:hypothetical protein
MMTMMGCGNGNGSGGRKKVYLKSNPHLSLYHQRHHHHQRRCRHYYLGKHENQWQVGAFTIKNLSTL